MTDATRARATFRDVFAVRDCPALWFADSQPTGGRAARGSDGAAARDNYVHAPDAAASSAIPPHSNGE